MKLTSFDRAKLNEQLILHEALRLRPYTDTLGNVTVAVGYNVTGRGLAPLARTVGRDLQLETLVLTRDEAVDQLTVDVDAVETRLWQKIPWIDALDPIRQRVLLDMGFNMGADDLLKFTSTLDCVRTGTYQLAAYHMTHTLWARETKTRATRLASMMETGKDYK